MFGISGWDAGSENLGLTRKFYWISRVKKVDIAQKLGVGKQAKKPYPLEKIGLAVKEELEK
jgi:hypothetical protein